MPRLFLQLTFLIFALLTSSFLVAQENPIYLESSYEFSRNKDFHSPKSEDKEWSKPDLPFHIKALEFLNDLTGIDQDISLQVQSLILALAIPQIIVRTFLYVFDLNHISQSRFFNAHLILITQFIFPSLFNKIEAIYTVEKREHMNELKDNIKKFMQQNPHANFQDVFKNFDLSDEKLNTQDEIEFWFAMNYRDK